MTEWRTTTGRAAFLEQHGTKPGWVGGWERVVVMGGKANVSSADGNQDVTNGPRRVRSTKAGGAATHLGWRPRRGEQWEHSAHGVNGSRALALRFPFFGSIGFFFVLRLAAAGRGFEHVLTCEGNMMRAACCGDLTFPFDIRLCYRCARARIREGSGGAGVFWFWDIHETSRGGDDGGREVGTSNFCHQQGAEAPQGASCVRRPACLGPQVTWNRPGAVLLSSRHCAGPSAGSLILCAWEGSWDPNSRVWVMVTPTGSTPSTKPWPLGGRGAEPSTNAVW